MFKKASLCGIGLCVEVDTTPKAGVGGFAGPAKIGKEGKKNVAIRNSKNPDLVILFTYDEWRVFLVGVKNGEFDVK